MCYEKGGDHLIKVTRINKVEEFYVNDSLIEFMEETPDTVISLESGKKIVVMETAEQVIARIVAFRQRVRDQGIGTRD